MAEAPYAPTAPRCPNCNYDLTGLDPRTPCPECGHLNGSSAAQPQANLVLGLTVAIACLLGGIGLWQLTSCTRLLSPLPMAVATIYSLAIVRDTIRQKLHPTTRLAAAIVCLGSVLGLAYTVTAVIQMFR